MISEVDLRDWEQVDFKRIRGVILKEPPQERSAFFLVLDEFIKSVELLKQKQLKHVPKLLQKE